MSMEASGEPSGGVVLIVGLGNPGAEYQFTPHNAGFLAIDRIAEHCGVVVANRRSKALTSVARMTGRQVVLAKPETWMNSSGLSVAALIREFEVEPTQDLIVIYDDVALPLGTIRVRERGSNGGHNGVQSITDEVGTEEWLRVRIGVAPEDPAAAERARHGRKEYVLRPFRKQELALLDRALDDAVKAVETILSEGASAAMSQFNRRLGAEDPSL